MSISCPRCSALSAGLKLCPRCLLDRELAPVLIGEHLQLFDVVGEGGMGTVFAAHDQKLDRRVAVKMLPPELCGDSEIEARFAREARAMAMLNHPNIVTVHDVSEEQGQPYLVMEWVVGGALAERLPLASDEAIALGIEICDALAYAHDHGVIHRDIKPENILLTADGHAKIADFGIARISGHDSRITAPHAALGTPHYMAPETLAGAEPEPGMDIFSLGVLLYHAVSGQLPVSDFSRVPPGLASVIQRAICSQRAERFISARTMGDALRALGPTRASTELPADQRIWLRAVAMIQTLASAVALWAFWLCITPEVLTPQEVRPLIMLATETLADGRVVSRARFEIWPVLGAALAAGIAIALYGFLRRQWRLAGLERQRPHDVVFESRLVLAMGLFAVAVYGVHRLMLEQVGLFAVFMPVLGGVFELVLLWFFWMAILELWRRNRPLWREWRLWLGIAVAQVPPTTALIGYLQNWVP